MKTSKLFWGIGLILLAVLLLLDAVGVITPLFAAVGGLSVWQLIGGLLLLCFVVTRLAKRRLVEVFVPLTLIFMIFEKNIAYLCGASDGNLINNWLVLGCAALVSVGVGILFPAGRRDRTVHFIKSGNASDSGNLGASTRYIDCNDFVEDYVENNLGSYTIHFENVDAYKGGGVLHVDNNLGAMTVYVPSSWHLTVKVDNSLGSTVWPNGGDASGPHFTVEGDNNLGKITIQFV